MCILKLIFLLLIGLTVSSCIELESNRYVEQNSKTSDCDGFQNLNKAATFEYEKDLSDYCEAEKLHWNYDHSSKTISFLHTRTLHNCAAQLRLRARKNGNTIQLIEDITQRDATNCRCYFDTYCEIANISESTLIVKFQNEEYLLDLSNENGTFILNTSTDWPCL